MQLCAAGMSKALLVQKGKQNVALNEKSVLLYVLSPFIVQLFESPVSILEGAECFGLGNLESYTRTPQLPLETIQKAA